MAQMSGSVVPPLVSVVIASFNHAPYVERAVRSVLEQSIADLEVLVVDDASTDDTADIVAALGDPRITLVRLKENRAEHPRNLALRLAAGRYVAFQNSDDVWRPGKLAAQIEILESRPDIVACFTNIEPIGPAGTRVDAGYLTEVLRTENRSQAAWLRRFFDHGNCLFLSSAVARRQSIVDLGGFRGSLIQLGDLDLWVRLAALGGFVVIEEALTQIRMLDNALSRPSPAQVRHANMDLAEVLMRYAEHPVLGWVPAAFPDIVGSGSSTTPAVLAGLARHAAGQSSVHRLFADRVMAAILDDPDQRREAIAAYGAQIVREFLTRRSRFEVHLATDGRQSGAGVDWRKAPWRTVITAGSTIGSRGWRKLRRFWSNR